MKKTLFFIFFLPLFTSAQVIVTCAGGGASGLGDGGPAVNAELNGPYGINLDDSGNLYICDEINERIRKVTNPATPGVGIITTIAGNGSFGYSGDGGLATNARLNSPIDVAIDHHGNVYFVDQLNNCVRKVTPTDTITTIAGTGIAGYNGDNIPATTAQLNIPWGVAVDSIGNIYIADTYNSRIRKVDTAGIITTIAGTGIAGFSPDGSLADTAQLDKPFTIRMDKAGNLFFYDSARIRKIGATGFLTTIAGNGITGYSGDSGLATAAEISGEAIAIDSVGNLFFADGEYAHIRKVDTTGIITTIAGNGISGFYGDNGNPLLAELDNPEGVAVDNSGDIYIGDVGNNRVRLVTTHPVSTNNIAGIEQGIMVYPNPCRDYCTMQITTSVNEQADVAIDNVTGAEVYKSRMLTNQPFTIQMDWPPGVYFINATTSQQHFNQKIIIQ